MTEIGITGFKGPAVRVGTGQGPTDGHARSVNEAPPAAALGGDQGLAVAPADWAEPLVATDIEALELEPAPITEGQQVDAAVAVLLGEAPARPEHLTQGPLPGDDPLLQATSVPLTSALAKGSVPWVSRVSGVKRAIQMLGLRREVLTGTRDRLKIGIAPMKLAINGAKSALARAQADGSDPNAVRHLTAKVAQLESAFTALSADLDTACQKVDGIDGTIGVLNDQLAVLGG